MKLGNFFNTTIRNFFRNTEVRQSVCAIASACSGGGGGLSEVTTENSDSVTFTGTGTQDNPLTAEVTGGGSNTFSNGLRENNGEVKLGLELVPPFTNGLLTEPTLLLFGDVGAGDSWGISLGNDASRTVQFQSNNASTGNSANILASANQLSITKENGAESSSIVFNTNSDIDITSTSPNFRGLTYQSDYSDNYDDRSIPDVGYVKSLLGSNANVIVTGTTQELVAGTYYTNNTTQNGTWTLPDIGENVGTRIGLINQNTGEVTINGTIYFNGAETNSLSMMAGESYILYENGLRWTVIA